MKQCPEEENIEFITRYAPDDFFKKSVNETFNDMHMKTNLASYHKELLLQQSLQGKARNGFQEVSHSNVKKGRRNVDDKLKIHRYPNTTIEDVIRVMDLPVFPVLKDRQAIIDDIPEYFTRYFNSLKNRDKNNRNGYRWKLINDKGMPLAGIMPFEWTLISNPLKVLIGAYIGGCVDSAAWRTKTENKYGIKLHKGRSRAVNLARLRRAGYTLEDLANRAKRDDIDIRQLERKRIISNKNIVKSSKNIVSAYIELERGYGISDDAAFLSVGLLFGIEAALGFLLIDAIDTWDKATPLIYKDGQDEKIGQELKKRYEGIMGIGSFPCTDRDVMNVIYLSSIEIDCRDSFPSCSQRRFVERSSDTSYIPLESHILWLRSVKEGGAMPPDMRIAFQKYSTVRFYKKFKERYDNLVRSNDIRRSFTLPKGDAYNGINGNSSNG